MYRLIWKGNWLADIYAEQNMSKTKYDFYQTETHVFVTILKRGLTLEQCKAHYTDGCLTVVAAGETLLNIRLSHPINPASLELKCLPSKVELKMAKVTSDQWEALEEKSEENKNKPALISWDKFAKEADDDEEKGDVNILFQKLYKDADDDTRKAMVKSYTESGGTVLSTNWKEISKKRTEVRPPDGMEYKKW
uniref:SGS domain-containing protein n=1 Tax=Wuchereria bancrofti TaxID=6293 RepID=A0A1I8EAI6_WUCBA